jgi:hypothetical protein
MIDCIVDVDDAPIDQSMRIVSSTAQRRATLLLAHPASY